MGIMNNKEWVVKAFETASEALLDILKTPQLESVHFEFDCRMDELPKMTYEIERLSLKEDEEGVETEQ